MTSSRTLVVHLAAVALLSTGACSREQGELRIQTSLYRSSALRPAQSGAVGLELTAARLSASEIELEGGADDEREASMGDAVLDVALGGNATTVVVDEVEAGSYHTLGIEFQRSDHAGAKDASIVVEGTFDGRAFRFQSGIEPEVEFPLEPEVDVPVKGSASVEITFDVGAWFAAEDGSTLDPGDGANQGAIEQNVLRSMRVSGGVIEDETNDD